jgi:hypothetical protein
LLLVSSALTLCGCANNPAGTPPLAVKISSACDRLLAPVALPAVSATDDARAAFVKDDAALLKARAEISSGHHCIVEQRQLYAAPGGKP